MDTFNALTIIPWLFFFGGVDEELLDKAATIGLLCDALDASASMTETVHQGDVAALRRIQLRRNEPPSAFSEEFFAGEGASPGPRGSREARSKGRLLDAASVRASTTLRRPDPICLKNLVLFFSLQSADAGAAARPIAALRSSPWSRARAGILIAGPGREFAAASGHWEVTRRSREGDNMTLDFDRDSDLATRAAWPRPVSETGVSPAVEGASSGHGAPTPSS